MAAAESDAQEEIRLRILVAGNPQVGKKTLIRKFIETEAGGKSKKPEHSDSEIVDLNVGGKNIQVDIVCRTAILSLLSVYLFVCHFFLFCAGTHCWGLERCQKLELLLPQCGWFHCCIRRLREQPAIC